MKSQKLNSFHEITNPIQRAYVTLSERDFKKTTTAMATGKSLNKSLNK